MRFDFAIFKDSKLICLIEYQGEGHYEQGEWFIPLEIRQKRDKLKSIYCEKNDIPLIEIPYWDFDKLNENYLKEKLYEYYY